ncbi:concanavalin A-like lectin/glucanase [Ascobolus immersus RN42]|uniref:Concanavalin A-like lectin/glucanase n=1 Tax=Ascobolus immersus RN42 TaxID=1160509 RepID=A0A3N4IR43_ASCIM|nr:concanavalin A-like lectin/glucanase [Ascobolus immersus RN42]
MASLTALTVPFLLASTLLHSAPVLAKREDCDCFTTTSSRGKTILYANYEYHDFRSFPSTLSASDASVKSLKSTPLTTNKTFTDDWSIQDWKSQINPEADFSVVNQVSNILPIQRSALKTSSSGADGVDESQLLLRSYKPTGSKQQYAAEMEHRNKDVFTASVRVNASMYGDPGAVIGIFFYRDGKSETDLEILTRDKHNIVRCTNQPALDEDGNEIPEASTIVEIDGSWTDHHEWRIDWEDDLNSWFYDGEKIAEKSWGVMKKNGYFVMNVWGDGGEWSGKMKEGGEAGLRVSQIGMVYNTTKDRDDGVECERICDVDDVEAFDAVTKTSTNAQKGAAGRARFGWGLGAVLGLVAMVLVV